MVGSSKDFPALFCCFGTEPTACSKSSKVKVQHHFVTPSIPVFFVNRLYDFAWLILVEFFHCFLIHP